MKRETQFFIPKEKYDDLRLAMDNSKDLVLVVFDATGKLKSAKPDTSTSRDGLENIWDCNKSTCIKIVVIILDEENKRIFYTFFDFVIYYSIHTGF